MAAIRLIAPELKRPVGIIHRSRKLFTPTAGKLIELLQEAAEVPEKAEAAGY